MSVLFLTHFIPIQIYSVEFMLKMTIQKQVLKVLQIIDWITLIRQSIFLSLNHFQIHSIPPWDTTATATNI